MILHEFHAPSGRHIPLPIQTMPLLRSLFNCEFGSYKDVAPTALDRGKEEGRMKNEETGLQPILNAKFAMSNLQWFPFFTRNENHGSRGLSPHLL
jgi:hypothetical protein